MNDNQDRINQLLTKLEVLLRRQDEFSREINSLRNEIVKLKTGGKEAIPGQQISGTKKEESSPPIPPQPKKSSVDRQSSKIRIKLKSDLEKFIGENLINKIGIAITVIGVSIGVKYSIEHDLISPLTRIILGYLAGIALMAFGIKLKKNYHNYSAVLVSGAIAIMYFITYVAYDFYALMPQMVAFTLMVAFTVFTVIAATHYDKQVIAHIGLVGAYAVPFLLGDETGKVVILFSYMAIINAGILAIAFRRYWKSLYYSSFGFTWLIYFMWFESGYIPEDHFGLALVFLSIFFITFYLSFLAYKLIRKEKFDAIDILLMLANSFIFYGIGYIILNDNETGEKLLGLFTLANAIVHFIVSTVIYRQRLSDRNLLYFVSGLVLVFITIAIPVQLDGNWVTILWAGEAALLFWIGRTKDVPFYEKLSYSLIILAFMSILHDWATVYNSYNPEQPDTRIAPLFNVNFLSSLIVTGAFGFINFLNRKMPSSSLQGKMLYKFMSFLIPIVLLFTIYYTFRMEIENYWDQLYADSALSITPEGADNPVHYRNHDLMKFKMIWIIIYTLLFVSALLFVNLKKLKNKILGWTGLGLTAMVMLVYLTEGLYELSELRESYLSQDLSQYYHITAFNISIRYVSYLFVVLALVTGNRYISQEIREENIRKAFDLLLHISIVWIASSELINWLDIMGSAQSYKLGLSILWGVYSFLLIALGIWKKKQYLRIGAIVLFGLTLLKLFFYDISHLDTIAKTIVFVSLGVLLLLISFLYNKYKNFMADES